MQKFTSIVPHECTESYHLAQRALDDMKASICQVLEKAGQSGMRSSEIGKILGIYHGRNGKHQGYIPWIILGILVSEGVAVQGTDRRYRLRSHAEGV